MANRTPQIDESQLREKAQHGDILFPFKYYSTALHFLYPEVPVHWHPEMELTMVAKGEADYSVNLNNYHVRAGDLICIQPNLLHSARVMEGSSMLSDSFVFHLNLLGNSAADFCALRYFIPIMEGKLMLPCIIRKDNAMYPELKAYFENLNRCCREQKAGYELEIKALLFHLLNMLIHNPETGCADTGNVHSERMKIIFNYIHTRYAEDVSIEDAARECHITASHFMRYFKEKSGMTFNRYLNQYRLQQSALLLAKGASITEAAYSCGFNNLPYFYKRFREYYHMTPREFQKQ